MGLMRRRDPPKDLPKIITHFFFVHSATEKKLIFLAVDFGFALTVLAAPYEYENLRKFTSKFSFFVKNMRKNGHGKEERRGETEEEEEEE